MKFVKGHTIEVAFKILNALLGLLEKGAEATKIKVSYRGNEFEILIRRIT